MKVKIARPCTIYLSYPDIKVIHVRDGKNHVYFKRKIDGVLPLNKGIFNNAYVNIPDTGEYDITVNGKSDFKIDYLPLQKSFLGCNMPAKERNRLRPYHIVLNKSMSGTPARINTHYGVIEVSPRFMTLPLYSQRFIIQHEIGHFFYRTEEYCDMYAARVLLDRGYNPSEILNTMKEVFRRSPLAIKRIHDMFINLRS